MMSTMATTSAPVIKMDSPADNCNVTSILKELFSELPEKLRPKQPVLMASEVLMEVFEYMMLLKKRVRALKHSPNQPVPMPKAVSPTPPIIIKSLGTLNNAKSNPSRPIRPAVTSDAALSNNTSSRNSSPSVVIAKTPESLLRRPMTVVTNSNSQLSKSKTFTLTREKSGVQLAASPTQRAVQITSEAGFDPSHGLICQLYCSCPLNQNDVPLKPEYKALVFQHLKRGMGIDNDKEIVRMLTTQQFQKDVFNTVVDSLARREMHRFLKLVSPENKNFRGNVGWCIAFKQEGTGSGISSGKITVNGRTFSLHQILFKFFRPNLSNVTLEDLILTSRKDCKVSRNSSEGSSRFCINPWHFERTDQAILRMSPNCDHKCETRLRISRKKAFFICPFCQQHRRLFASFGGDNESIPTTEDRLEEPIAEVQSVSGGQRSTVTPIAIASELINVKREENEDESESADQLDRDFEEALGSLEEQVRSEETWKPPTGREKTTPNILVGSKRKREPMMRCWKCFSWYPKNEIQAHSCLPRLSQSLLCCLFCGVCSTDVNQMNTHVQKCKAYGMRPRAELVQESKPSQELESQSRAKRAKKIDTTNTKCPGECGLTFADSMELSYHMMKDKCKSIQCARCNKFYANARSHQSHECQKEESTQDGLFDLRLEDDKDSSMPVECPDCSQLLRSRSLLAWHQNEQGTCASCKTTFNSICKLTSHDCPGLIFVVETS